jgi:hypothetical protein
MNPKINCLSAMPIEVETFGYRIVLSMSRESLDWCEDGERSDSCLQQFLDQQQVSDNVLLSSNL